MHSSVFFLGNQDAVIFFIKIFTHLQQARQSKYLGGCFSDTEKESFLRLVLFKVKIDYLY
jgi:hypothetical protein